MTFNHAPIRGRWLRRLTLCAALLGVLASTPVRAAVTDEQVSAAMKRGVDYLLKRKQKDNWEVQPKWWDHIHNGGETALVTYALLHVGESMDDPRLRPKSEEMAPAIDYLIKLNPQTSYTAALQVCALSLVHLEDRKDIPKVMERSLAFLATGMQKEGGQNYGGPYDRVRPWWWDASNTQYAVLAFWAAADARIEVRQSYWRLMDNFWRSKQRRDGGWGYTDVPLDGKGRILRPDSYPPMNAAGLASLLIVRDQLDLGVSLDPRPDKALEAAIAKVSADFNPSTTDYYYLYGVERVGLASGYKFFGTTNWYKAAAESIVRAQQPDGSWTGQFAEKGAGGENPLVATSYALLILARGRNPVVFNKLQYGGKDSRWEARPRDNANITAWMAHSFEKPINWQVVNAKVPVDEWMDAPILLITGSKDPKFSPEEIAHLREFVEAGGLIFSTADGADKEFTEAIRTNYAPALCGNKYEMRELPEDHAIFNNQLWKKIPNPPRMLGLSNGVRELWIHSTVDMGAAWHARKYAQQDYFNIPANIYFYATGKGSLRNKLQSLAVAPAKAPTVRKISVGRLEYAGNWDPEPAAWPRMVKIAQSQFRTDLTVAAVKMDKLDAAAQPVVHMTGTTAFEFNAGDAAKLRAYLDAGGTLIADAAGGSAAFTESFTKFVAQLYPKTPLSTLPLNHPVYNGAIADTLKADVVEYRKYNALVQGASSTPRLMAVTDQGRPTIIFSPDDLTHGMLGTTTWGILGYSPASAQALLRNALLVATTKAPG